MSAAKLRGTVSRVPEAASKSQDEQLLQEGAIDWIRLMVPVSVALLTFLMCIFPARDTDFWWHLRTGEFIWQQFSIPGVDLYTYTDFDKPWIDLHWGFQLLVAGIYHLTGINGIILFKAACYTTAVMIGWFAAGNRIPDWCKALIWFPAIIAITGRAYERPEMISMLALGAVLWLLERVSSNPRLIWCFPPLLIVWANFHALFVLGLVVVGAFVFAGMFRNLFPKLSSPESSDPALSMRNLFFLGGGTLAAPLVNPYLEEGWFFPLVLYRKFSVEQAFYTTRVGEFQQPIAYLNQLWQKSQLNFSSLFGGLGLIYPLAEFGVFLISAGAVMWLFLKYRTVSVYHLLLLAGFSHLAWVATRNTSVFALVATVVACNAFNQLRSRRGVDRSSSQSVKFDQLITVFLGLMMGIVVSGGWGMIAEHWKVFGWNEAKHWFGHEAMKFAGRPDFPQRAYVSHFGLAGVYSYHNGPERKVFMDPRLEVCTRETFEKFEKVGELMAKGDFSWESLVNFDGKGLPVVILDSRSNRMQINQLMTSGRWRLVFADPAAAVFIHSGLADELKLEMVDPRPLHRPPE